MAAVTNSLVTVFGGSGFVGRHVVRLLARRGFRVRVAVRRPDLAQYLMTAGAVGQVNAVQANLRYPESVEAAVEGASAVINLVGVLHGSGRNTFEAVHHFGAGAIARAARSAGVTRLVHVSSLAAAESVAEYARTKRAGEAAALEAFAEAVIIRPSVIFGPEDGFFNKLAGLVRMTPVVPLVGAGAKFQPVFVGDVAEVVTRGVEGELTPGAPYELGGPEVMTMRELAEYVAGVINRRRLLVPVPFPIAGILGSVAQFAPGAPLTPDQVALLKSDSVVSEAAVSAGRTLAGLGVRPVTVEAEVPSYLWRFRKAGQFENLPA